MTEQPDPTLTPDDLRVLLDLVDLGVRQGGSATFPVLVPLEAKLKALLSCL